MKDLIPVLPQTLLAIAGIITAIGSLIAMVRTRRNSERPPAKPEDLDKKS